MVKLNYCIALLIYFVIECISNEINVFNDKLIIINSKDYDQINNKLDVIIYDNQIVIPFIINTHLNANDSLCIKLYDINLKQQLFDYKCIEVTNPQSSILLSNIPEGLYQSNLLLINQTILTNFTLDCKLFINSNPKIVLSNDCNHKTLSCVTISADENYCIEEGIDSNIEQSKSISFQYKIDTLSSSIDLIELCIEITNYQQAIYLSMTCISTFNDIITLNKINKGDYIITLIIREKNSLLFIESSKININLYIKQMIEFIPSYDWKILHAWHTIPSGLEIKLPLSTKGGNKVARIPNPWRLQLTMPSPCKYFLRLDVYYNTRIEEVLNKAAKTCSMNSNCFSIISNNITLSHDMTIGDSNLFINDNHLVLDLHCLEINT